MGAILITGGAGYIGSHVAWACVDAGREVVILDNLSTGARRFAPADARFIVGDVGDLALVSDLFEQHDIDAVMHFAGSISVPDSLSHPVAYYANNTVNSHALVSATLAAGVRRLIFSSTAAVYGPGRQRVSEDAPTAPASPYGWSKLMTEQMLADFAQAHGLSYCALRYFNVSGADPAHRTGQCTANSTHLIKVATQTALGLRPELVIHGDDYDTVDGTCVRDYIHVSDLAQAHLLALEHLESGGASQVMNVGYGHGASVRAVIQAVEKITASRLRVRVGPRRPGDAPALVADNAKILRTLAWRPQHDDLEDIVGATLAWEKRNVSAAQALS